MPRRKRSRSPPGGGAGATGTAASSAQQPFARAASATPQPGDDAAQQPPGPREPLRIRTHHTSAPELPAQAPRQLDGSELKGRGFGDNVPEFLQFNGW
jgi:hypothetical protein